jgi:prepilin-type N-terminal cleavage/methylation domain-containing protein/prepilin-type processing-associated H-X9-DG protein
MTRAFTLLELLVTVAIVAVLAAIAFPAARYFQDRARAAGCMTHLRALGAGLNFYVADHHGFMPNLKLGRESLAEEAPVIDTVLDRYVNSKKAFACPADTRIAAATGTSYHWNIALNGQSVANLNFLGITDKTGHIPVMGDKEGFHRDPDHRVNILYADGHASKELNFVEGL